MTFLVTAVHQLYRGACSTTHKELSLRYHRELPNTSTASSPVENSLPWVMCSSPWVLSQKAIRPCHLSNLLSQNEQKDPRDRNQFPLPLQTPEFWPSLDPSPQELQPLWLWRTLWLGSRLRLANNGATPRRRRLKLKRYLNRRVCRV